MRKKLIFAALMCAVMVLPFAAHAELQNVEVGGSIEIYGNYYTPFWEVNPQTRIPAFFLPYRAIGGAGAVSGIRADGDGNSLSWVEQRTTVSVKADFTDDVCAFIELDSIDTWGEDFRSNYITGADSRAWTGDDVEVYQAYIQASNMFDTPVTMRVGRQELKFGSEWLVGNNPVWNPLTYLSFDAIRLTYDTEVFSLDAFAAKLAERSPLEEDGDTDFYGVYGTFKGIENMEIDAYWLFLRDGRRLNDTNFIAPLEWLEDVFDLDDYDVTNIHTVGMRFAGVWAGFDMEAEAAYQWGDANTVGATFIPNGELYGDDDAEYDTWAGNIEVGYTFDTVWQPRLWVGASYYGGEDERDITLIEWLNPFDRPEASVSFNRLFSSSEPDWYFDPGNLSNAWVGKGGVSLAPTESLTVGVDVLYFEALEAFDSPASIGMGGWLLPLAPALPFWTQEGETELGWETILWAEYAYTEDLTFVAGWTHLFAGEALDRGVFSGNNGLGFLNGRESEDGDYMYLGTTIKF